MSTAVFLLYLASLVCLLVTVIKAPSLWARLFALGVLFYVLAVFLPGAAALH